MISGYNIKEALFWSLISYNLFEVLEGQAIRNELDSPLKKIIMFILNY